MISKVSIIGAGAVGSQAASLIAQRGLAHVVLLDILGDMAKGKALDIAQSLPLFHSNVSVIGGDNYTLTKDSTIIVIAAGIARKPGMTRDQLLETNAPIIADVTRKAIAHSPKAIIIVVTNPLDALVSVVKTISGFPRERIIGMAGLLDSARFKYFLAQEACITVDKVEAIVIGSHSETMVPVASSATMNGRAAIDVLGKERLAAVVEKVKNGGAEINNLLKNASTSFAPGAAITAMVESILKDQQRTIPCSVLLDGEYGTRGCAIGVPVVLGKKGARVIELELPKTEMEKFKKSVTNMKELTIHAEKLVG